MRKVLFASSLVTVMALAIAPASAIDLGGSASLGGGASVGGGLGAGANVDASAAVSLPQPSAVPSEGVAPAPATTDFVSIIGSAVVSAEGSKVGKVSAVAIEENGSPKAIVAKIGGFLGLGGTEVSFPIESTNVAAGQVQLRASKSELDAFIDAGGTAQASTGDAATFDASATTAATVAANAADPVEPTDDAAGAQ